MHIESKSHKKEEGFFYAPYKAKNNSQGSNFCWISVSSTKDHMCSISSQAKYPHKNNFQHDSGKAIQTCYGITWSSKLKHIIRHLNGILSILKTQTHKK